MAPKGCESSTVVNVAILIADLRDSLRLLECCPELLPVKTSNHELTVGSSFR